MILSYYTALGHSDAPVTSTVIGFTGLGFFIISIIIFLNVTKETGEV